MASLKNDGSALIRPDGIHRTLTSYLDFLDLKDQNRSFTDIAAFGTGTYNISDDIFAPERVVGSRITSNLFSLIGEQPILGRDFAVGEDHVGAEPVVIIGYGLWQSRYSGAYDVIGRTLKSNGVAHKIIGVMPSGMKFPLIAELWLPLAPTASSTDRGARNTDVFGRLREGVSVAQARADLNGIAQRLAKEYPQTNKNIDIVPSLYSGQFNRKGARQIVFALLGAVGFVLLIVCANLANLLLTRAVHRTRETAIRLAIGATRTQIVRQLLVETLLLSFSGGLLGLVLSIFGVKILVNTIRGITFPYWVNFTIDYRVVLYFLVISFATGIVFGLAPALQITRTDVNVRLREGGAESTGTRSRKLTSLLITCEIAFTLILLAGAGLMVRSLLKFYSSDIGIPTENMLFGTFILTGPKYSQPADRIAFEQQLLEGLHSTLAEPVTLASHAPGGSAQWRKVWTEERELARTATITVVPGYFKAIGAGILRGREFSEIDGSPGNEAAVVNARFAAQYWPGQDPLGKRVRLSDQPNEPWLTVVGVSSNVHIEDEQEFEGVVYVPYRQEASSLMVLITKSRLPHDAVVKALRSEVQKMDPDLPIFNVVTIEEYGEQMSVGLRVLGSMFSVFAAIALLISTIGVYAVTAYSVSQRTKEIGIRMALGANGRSVAWLVAKQGLLQLTIGLTLGLIGALAMTRILTGFMFQVTPTDGPTFVLVLFVLSAATLAACIVPAMRAINVDPAAALRPQ